MLTPWAQFTSPRRAHQLVTPVIHDWLTPFTHTDQVLDSDEVLRGLPIAMLKQTDGQVRAQDHCDAMENQKRWISNSSL